MLYVVKRNLYEFDNLSNYRNVQFTYQEDFSNLVFQYKKHRKKLKGPARFHKYNGHAL